MSTAAYVPTCPAVECCVWGGNSGALRCVWFTLSKCFDGPTYVTKLGQQLCRCAGNVVHIGFDVNSTAERSRARLLLLLLLVVLLLVVLLLVVLLLLVLLLPMFLLPMLLLLLTLKVLPVRWTCVKVTLFRWQCTRYAGMAAFRGSPMPWCRW